MNVNAWVKEHGWDKAKELLAKANGCASIKSMGHHFLYSDLERLVESWELIKPFKTKKNANAEFMKACMRGQTERANMIKKAIADVESCQ